MREGSQNTNAGDIICFCAHLFQLGKKRNNNLTMSMNSVTQNDCIPRAHISTRHLVLSSSPTPSFKTTLQSLKSYACFHTGITDYNNIQQCVSASLTLQCSLSLKCFEHTNIQISLTTPWAVRLSYPVPTESKQIPVMRSWVFK